MNTKSEFLLIIAFYIICPILMFVMACAGISFGNWIDSFIK